MIGTDFSDTELIGRAHGPRHPFDSGGWTSPSVHKCIFIVLTSGLYATMMRRRQALEFMRRRAEVLHEEGLKMHETAPADRQRVLHSKNFLMLQDLATAAGVQDADLASDAFRGCPVTGLAKPSGQFEPIDKPDPLPEAAIRKTATWNRELAIARMHGHG